MRSAALLLLLAAGSAGATGRAAVVVGANAGEPGRARLRFAHDDARSLAGVLVELGGFAPGDVVVLLDPDPERLLAELDVALARLAGDEDGLLLFYYSGHADGRHLFPGGKALPLAALKQRLEDGRSRVRVGILDACRGGTWTSAKGLVPAESFPVDVPLTLGAEGSALLASSSGLQDAHEAESIGGSFFTFHLVAGLRGAADRSGDGEVTLGEAFDHARELTVRDSALLARVPQHPSFEVSLRGRRDLPLTRVPAGGSRLAIDQVRGPIQLVRLDAGLVVAELPAGPRRAVIALPPGRYLARRRDGERTHAAEIVIEPGALSSLAESDLAPFDAGRLAMKGVPRLPGLGPAEREVLLAGAVGRTYSGEAGNLAAPVREDLDSELGGRIFAAIGVSDAVAISVAQPGVIVRLGAQGPRELVLWTGLDGSWPEGRESLLLLPGLGAAGRLDLGPGVSLLATAAGESVIATEGGGQVLDLVRPQLGAGVLLAVGGSVTLGAGVSAEQRLAWDPDDRRARLARGATVVLGSTLELARRAVPLVQVHVSDHVSLDGHARLLVDTAAGTVRESYLGGATVRF